MLSSSLGKLRLAGVIEGISFLLLLFIAMPLKYGAGLDMAVTVAGSLHGALFILYILFVLVVWIQRRWSFLRAFIAMAVSVIPFGPFVFDKSLRREQETGVVPDSFAS
ncbi:integral membrane protein [Alteribacillus persepolensis]|uniref:Integral membrane protein n=1 Tax=Alteribacillus persepolensis TaxID=568899 RepID=A0A1G8G6F0_9BACI|nr:DUF3817 domain-containing protein [Alteribacillus persepolensis]SDH89861.1 integral membrane protein [Alteribacillus persepolensis]